jgi:hypothetical protein
MPTAMNAKQIAQVAYNAGWRGEQLVIATAVALAESSGQYWVVNPIGCVGLWQINSPVHPQWPTAAMKDPAKNAAAAYTLWKSEGWKPWEAYTGPDGKGSDGPYTTQMGRARLAAASIKGAGNVSVTPASDSSTGGGTGSVDPIAWQNIGGNADQALNIAPALPGLIGPLLKWFEHPNGGGALVDGADSLFGPFVSVGKAMLAISVLSIRTAKWLADPHNWLRVVEVLGGAVALFIGLKMLAGTGVGGPVGGAVKVTVDTAGKAVHAAKKTAKTAAAAGTAVATGGASAAAAAGGAAAA